MAEISLRNSHKMFLQSFMSRGLLDAREVKLLYKQSCEFYDETYPEGEDEKRSLAEFVNMINDQLRQFHLEIKKGISEEDGSNYYGLVNNSESSITKLASDYSPNELEYFKKLVEKIVETDNGMIGSVCVLNLTDHLDKKMSKQDAERLLERLEREHWIKSSKGLISLATRSILELEQYILEGYPEIAGLCNMCNRLCLKGRSCDSCGTKLHLHCAKRYFRHQETPKCPQNGCGAPWPYVVSARESGRQAEQQNSGSHDTKKQKRN